MAYCSASAPLRDALVGTASRSVAFFLFTRLLGIYLPAGLTPITCRQWMRDLARQRLRHGAQPQNLLYALIGVTVGTFVGVLPGIGPALTIALLLPVTLQPDYPVGTFIMFAGIYYGAMYGGSTTSILLNTPGESASVATAIEGYQMARGDAHEPRWPRPRSGPSWPARSRPSC